MSEHHASLKGFKMFSLPYIHHFCSMCSNNLVFFHHVLDEISKMPWFCFHIDILSTVLIPFIHIFALLLACHDWLIMSNACMLLVKQLLVISFSKYENDRETKAQPRHHSIYWFLIWKLVGEMVWECEWGKFISDRAWTCGAGRTRADLVNSSSVWSAGSSDGPVQAAGSGSAPPGCGYWRSSALYSAACPASVTATAQSHYTAMQDLHSSCSMKEEKTHLKLFHETI